MLGGKTIAHISLPFAFGVAHEFGLHSRGRSSKGPVGNLFRVPVGLSFSKNVVETFP